MADETKRLTAKQFLFVQEYIIDDNGTQAAIRAGYSADCAAETAYENLRKPHIIAAIDEAQAMRLKRLQITQDYVLSTIVNTIQRCSQAEPVTNQNGDAVLVRTPDGELTPAYKFDAANVLKGTEQLGKHLGMFKDNLELTGKDGKELNTGVNITITPEMVRGAIEDLKKEI